MHCFDSNAVGAKTGETDQPYYLAGIGALILAGAAILLLRKRKTK